MRFDVLLMPGPSTAGAARRRAFTLVELLVVIFLIVILVGMTVYIGLQPFANQQTAEGASQLQGWLTMARQRALLDRAPVGLRLFPDPNNPKFLTQAQLIQQPDDFSGGECHSPYVKGVPVLNELSFTSVDLTGGFAKQELWSVQPGDYIQVQGNGLRHRIATVSPQKVQLDSNLAQPISTPTNHYSILRAPRLLGTEVMKMPSTVAIDVANSQYPLNPLNSAPPRQLSPLPAKTTVDILFAPSGEVLQVLGGSATGRLVLYVRDSTLSDIHDGEPTLIVVYTSSGLIEPSSVNQPPYPANKSQDEYSFVP
jgi:prepilin-type N-terminal cleavage/methylation domain-containing protein